ncbi:MAG: endonuclease domain-containing protein [Clostridia bacterium]|nr:endonuclease domain-containing protein [Clostridia bacterium]
MKPYNRSHIPLAKELRKAMTPWERKLWYEFLRTYPLRFQRQKAIGEYIADFYCAKAQLVVELDGGGHYTAEQEQKDCVRTRELERMGLTVLRFCNADVDKNFRGVCACIDRAVKQSLPQSASLTAPSSEGAAPKPLSDEGGGTAKP